MKRFTTIIGCLLVSILLVLPASAQTQPPLSFGKAFAPASIGPGSTSVLTFTITNTTAGTASNVSFTDVLPAGVVIATPASAFTDCSEGILSAPDAGTTIDLTNGKLGPGASCIVSVNVTSSTVGSHRNVSGVINSSLGTGGRAQATLVVDPNRPGFSKSFEPNAISLGGTSTLILTINTQASDISVSDLEFTDELPGGMIVATPSNASNNCGGTLTATPGANTIAFSLSDLDSGVTCTLSVDVTTTGAGTFNNVSGNLSYFSGEEASGFATDRLDVAIDFLLKSFTDDPVAPGGTVTLEFTLQNPSRSEAATNLGFTDNLGFLSGLTPAETLPKVACGGTLSFTPSVLTFSGGSLPPEGTCTFSVLLQVPAGASPGTYTNTTSTITGQVGGAPVTGNTATDQLSVAPAPILKKTFTDDPVTGGGTVTLEFMITNSSLASAATDLAFTDVLPAIIPTAASVPANGFCGPSSSLVFTPLSEPPGAPVFTPASLAVSGASLAAGASCTFSVVLNVEVGAQGTYTNTTSEITGRVNGTTYTGNQAVDDLVVVAAPQLLKSFTNDPVLPGGTVTLEFTLSHDEFAPGNATNIAFTDNLNATLAGLAATGLPLNNICGPGSSLTGSAGDTFLTFSGGTLSPDATCTFSVTLNVPSEATAGPHPNTTSNVTATVAGVAATSLPATDDLKIAALTLTKSFLNDPVLPGGTVTLRFTINNVSPTANATNIFFQDNLSAVLAGLVSTSSPQFTICGGSSSISGTNLLTFTGGSLAPSTSCTFQVTLNVPAATASETYLNTTSNFQATINGTPATFDNATDNLVVESRRLTLAKAFTDDPVAPGSPATLEFTLTNLDGANAVSAIAFSDNLNATLAGLQVTGLPLARCGGTVSSPDGGLTLNFSSGSLAAGAVCTFSVTLAVPAGAPDGTYTNTTSGVTGTLGGLGVTADPASDDLVVRGPAALLELRVLLGGPYASPPAAAALRVGGLAPARILAATPFMRTDLSAVLPSTDPYLGTQSVAAGFFATPIGQDVVDWVLIKLVTGDPTTGSLTVAAQQPGLLLANGAVVGTDGTSPLAFNVNDGAYRIVVCHRNHLPVLSSVALLFRRGGAPVVYDFTTGQNQAYDAASIPGPGQQDLGTTSAAAKGNSAGPFGLFPGDINQDGFVKYSGPNNDRALILDKTGSLTGVLTNQYAPEDVNLDSEVKYSGADNDRALILNTIGSLSGVLQSQVPSLIPAAAPATPTLRAPGADNERTLLRGRLPNQQNFPR